MKFGECRIVFSTINSSETAKEIAREAVEKRLAASCNILPGSESIFRWKGEICERQELLMIFYTRKNLTSALSQLIKDKHPYEVPLVAASDISDGLSSCLKWISSNTASSVEDY